jgi:outer membrane autotransporter protein
MAFGAQTGGPSLLLGADAGFDTDSFQVGSRETSGTVEGEHVGLYAAASRAGFYALGQIDGDFFQNNVLRDIDAVSLTEATVGRLHDNGVTARLEIGRPFDLAPIRLTPFAAVQASEIFSPGYLETAAPGRDLFALGYEGQTSQSLKSDLGLELAGDWKVAGALTPYVRADWLHEFDPAREITPYFSTFGSSPFTVFGATAAQDTARVEAGFSWAIAPGVTASASYVGDVGANTLAVGGMAGIRVAW